MGVPNLSLLLNVNVVVGLVVDVDDRVYSVYFL